MFGKSTVFIHQYIIEVVSNSDFIAVWSKKTAAPVRNRVGNAMLKYPSVVNSLIGTPPMVGQMRVRVDVLWRA